MQLHLRFMAPSQFPTRNSTQQVYRLIYLQLPDLDVGFQTAILLVFCTLPVTGWVFLVPLKIQNVAEFTTIICRLGTMLMRCSNVATYFLSIYLKDRRNSCCFFVVRSLIVVAGLRKASGRSV